MSNTRRKFFAEVAEEARLTRFRQLLQYHGAMPWTLRTIPQFARPLTGATPPQKVNTPVDARRATATSRAACASDCNAM
jgi:hypothetical protein